MAKGYQCDSCKVWFPGQSAKTSVEFTTQPLLPHAETSVELARSDIQVWGMLKINLTDYGRDCDWCAECVTELWQLTMSRFWEQKEAQP